MYFIEFRRNSAVAQYNCPECPPDADPVDGRGFRSHLHSKHGIGESLGDSEALDPVVDSAEQVDPEPDPDPEPNEPENTHSNDPEPDDNPQDQPDESEPKAPESDQMTTQPDPNAAEPEPQPEPVDVRDDGEDKLRPSDDPGAGRTGIDPPAGAPERDPDEWEEPDRQPDPDPEPEPETDDDSGGLLNRIKGDRSGDPDPEPEPEPEPERPTDRVISDAPPEEREDLREKRDKLEEATSEDDDGPGLSVDREVVEMMFEMPFDMAAERTDFDGWRLTDSEKERNAALFIAMCEEQDIDPGATTMFGISLASTAGGKYMQYRQHVDAETAENDDTDDQSNNVTEAAPDAEELQQTTDDELDPSQSLTEQL